MDISMCMTVKRAIFVLKYFCLTLAVHPFPHVCWPRCPRTSNSMQRHSYPIKVECLPQLNDHEDV